MSAIIENVRQNGDAALRAYCLKFDRVELESLEVTADEIDAAFDAVEPAFIDVLRAAAANVRAFHEKQARQGFIMTERRGVVMGHLRRYGDFFAVAMASVVFALMHCNLIQAPFALIVGFALGYLCIRTGSLWTAVAVHALNNTISLVFSYLLERYDETAVNLAYTVLIDALMAAGAICLCVLLFRRRKRPALSRTTPGFWRKTFWFFCNPPMLVALGLMIWFTMRYVGPAG